MSKQHHHLLFAWVFLLILGVVEFGAAQASFAPSLRPLLMLPALCMVAIVGVMFMELPRGPGINRIFAIAALFWLTILLGLGMMDPLTRAVYSLTG